MDWAASYKLRPAEREPVDRRDFRAADLLPASAELPSSFDLPRLFPVRDQERRNACVAFATTEILQRAALLRAGTAVQLSPLHLYYTTRVIDGWPTQDIGSWPRSAMKAAARWGVAPEPFWPYADKHRFAEEPGPAAKLTACFHRNWTYSRIDDAGESREQTIRDLKLAIVSGVGATGAIMVYGSFWNAAGTGRIQTPSVGEQPQGSHDMAYCGWDDAEDVFIVKNSYSSAWGRDGYGTVPMDYLRSGLFFDAWTVLPTR